MEIRYNLTPGDIVDLSMDALAWTGTWRLYIVSSLFPLAACYMAFLAWDAYGLADWTSVVMFVVFAIAMLFMGLFFARPLLRLSLMIGAAVNFDHKLNTNLTMLVTPDTITLNTSISKSMTGWDGVERMAITPKHAFIYLSKRTAFVVPARAFQRVEEFQSFVDKLRSYHEAAVHHLRSNDHEDPERETGRI